MKMLNINGVLYKSTTNKLQKSDVLTPATATAQPKPLTRPNLTTSGVNTAKQLLFIRGEKFELESSGKSLRRINSDQNPFKLRRIDIGGMTYLAKPNSQTYERTESHKTRSHLSLAKCKSINVLTKKFVKSNIPCPIFRRVGKCSAYARGRCPRVHDPKNVAICQK